MSTLTAAEQFDCIWFDNFIEFFMNEPWINVNPPQTSKLSHQSRNRPHVESIWISAVEIEIFLFYKLTEMKN